MLDTWAVRNSRWKKVIASVMYETRNLRGARCVHALCAAERDAIRHFGVQAPIAVVPNGVDLSIADGPHELPGWMAAVPPDSQVLLFLGRIHPKKGLASFIQAFAACRSRRVARWHLVVAGWDQGGHQAELQALASACGVPERVHFVGPQFGSDKAASLAHAHAFVLPSHSEGLPMAVLEAWAFGKPVLMTDACNLPEGFSSGAAVRLPDDVGGMSRVTDEFVERDEAERVDIGVKGRQLAASRFGWESIADQMVAVYRWSRDGGAPPSSVDQIVGLSARHAA
jgi:poly(glycerol-phosphate) alpha-glucosyltransferase